MMSIQYDTTNLKKIVKIVPDSNWVKTETNLGTVDDIPANLETINFYYNWRAFYWFYKGQLIIK